MANDREHSVRDSVAHRLFSGWCAKVRYNEMGVTKWIFDELTARH